MARTLHSGTGGCTCNRFAEGAVSQAGMDALPPDAIELGAYGEDAPEPVDDPPRAARAVVVGLLFVVPLWVVVAVVAWLLLRGA
jgi:hypothetical protein